MIVRKVLEPDIVSFLECYLFYGSYSPNGSLYELGQVVSGSEQIKSMEEGMMTIKAVPK
ncbi:hypothetical protein J31TS4_03380 [Paenibacillus sp. J31TS4]|nr:hypothetical protein J31TS4_03380 [Paenibacillus sp. J31TS4]